MKIIGRNLQGGVLLEAELEEFAAMQAAAIALRCLPELVVAGPVENILKTGITTLADETTLQGKDWKRQLAKKAKDLIRVMPSAKPAKKAKPATEAKSGKANGRVCTCGKPIRGKGRHKYCSKACSKAADDASNKRSYERKHGAKKIKKTPAAFTQARARQKQCAICRKSFTDDSKTNTRKTCSDKCREEQRKIVFRGVVGKPGKLAELVTPPANPADPGLTDEQRSLARLEIIKRSAQAHAED